MRKAENTVSGIATYRLPPGKTQRQHRYPKSGTFIPASDL